MPRRLLRTAAATSALLAVPVAAAEAAAVPAGPSGTAFYSTPSPLGGAKHGDLLRARRLTGRSALPGAARTDLLLYRGTGVRGKPVAISGALSLPKGKAPKGGWPVVSFAHALRALPISAPPRAPRVRA